MSSPNLVGLLVLSLLFTGIAQAQLLENVHSTLPGLTPDHLPVPLANSAAVWVGDGAYIIGGNNAQGTSSQILHFIPGRGAIPVAMLPGPLTRASAAYDGKDIYIFGGHDGSQPLSSILRFTPGSPAAVAAGSMPTLRSDTSVIYDGKAFYIFGGKNVGYWHEALRYDPVSQTAVPVVRDNQLLDLAGTAAVWDGVRYAYIFGGNFDNYKSSRIARFEPATLEVSLLPSSLPAGVTEAAAVWDGQGTAHLFGGILNSGESSAVQSYTPCTGALAPSTALSGGLQGAAAVMHGSKVYLIGGSRAGAASDAITTYPVAATSLEGPCLQLPHALARSSAVWLGGRALQFGGDTELQASGAISAVRPDGSVPVTVTTLPSPRTATSAATDGTAAYIFGGSSGTTFLSEIVRYEPGSAPEVVGHLPSGRDGTSAIYDGQAFYVFGGNTAVGRVSDVVRFDPATRTSVKVASLPAPRSEASVMWDGTYAYLFGGYDGTAIRNQVYRFSPATNQILTMGPMPIATTWSSAVWNGADAAYLFGGKVGSAPTSTLLQYFPCGDKWSVAGSLPEARERTAAVSDGVGRAYILGGRQTVSTFFPTKLYPIPTAVTVNMTTAASGCTPTVSVPPGLTVEATGPLGAAVSFIATASEGRDGVVPVTCAPASGSAFPMGRTTVTCAARDSSGYTGTAVFDVTVVDSTPPALRLPLPIVAEATDPNGAVVTFAADASDLVDGAVLTSCTLPSGSMFPLGLTAVSCSATDGSGNVAVGTFEVTVRDTTAPVITVPDGIAVVSPHKEAYVRYEASALDAVDGFVAVACSPASGSAFAQGSTVVACSSVDGAGNMSTASFTVDVDRPGYGS